MEVTDFAIALSTFGRNGTSVRDCRQYEVIGHDSAVHPSCHRNEPFLAPLARWDTQKLVDMNGRLKFVVARTSLGFMDHC
jgi:hypothetical protein